jgi:hypothetical protein
MVPKRNNSWQYARQVGLVSACILSNVPAINRMKLVPPRGRAGVQFEAVLTPEE